MRNWVSRRTLAFAVAALAAAIPALGQEGPESLLPPGFGPAAPARPAAPTAPAPGQQTAPAAPGIAQAPGALPGIPAPLPEEAEPKAYSLPPPVSRPIDHVGSIGPGTTGFPSSAFAGASGQYLTTLMQRLDAPIASRWAAIVLRRALLSNVPTASGSRPADWVAERALLLVRMGDAPAARMLVQAVPVDRYTPRLYAVAVQVALANADIAGLCPIADVGEGLTREAIWPIARAMCAGLSGDTGLAAALADRARQRKTLGSVDLALSERIADAAAGSQRNANVDWTQVKRLNIYRYGLATASGIDIPARLLGTAGPQVQAWRASAPSLSLEQRIAAARAGAALGMISSADLVDLYAALAEETDPFEIANTPAGKLRKAYVEADATQRLDALKDLWEGDIRTRDGYAARILTARAVARIEPDEDLIEDAGAIIGSMLSAGLDRQAAQWWPVLEAAGESDAAEGWALLAVGAPRAIPVSEGRIRNWASRDKSARGRHRAALLVAALAGLGRLEGGVVDELGGEYGAALGARSRYLERIDRAAAEGRGGEVALLAGIGLQTPRWSGVPPQHLFHILAALRRVGREAEARMIAVEALMRS
jgi:hypothetical protein